MRNTLLVIFIFGILNVFGQTEITPDERLYVSYPQEYIDNLLERNPQSIDYMNFCLDNAFSFIELPDEKVENLPRLYARNNFNKTVSEEPVETVDENDFIIFNYKYQTEIKTNSMYRIGNTNRVLVIYSAMSTAEKFNQSKQ